MKRLMLFPIACLFSHISFAQTNIFPATGYAGVGTTLPEALLHVAGESNTLIEIRADRHQNGISSSTLQLRKSRGTKSAPANIVNGDYVGGIEGWGYCGSNYHRGFYITSIVNGTPTANYIPTDLVFATRVEEADAIERMRLDKYGNLGIGTSAPTEKLTVAGKINAREVKVTATAGADFVFDKDYHLPSLESIEKYIGQNHHLPEIASAAEMKDKGIELGEMNIKLLQKIEELTLHLIRQEKEIIALKKAVRLP